METETKETAETSATYHICPNHGCDLIWQEIPDIPGEWGWCCPECPYSEF